MQLCSLGITAKAVEKPKELYAQSAVLMDADSGRCLFEKNGNKQRAMASTTKIITCIIALEEGDLESEVTASEEVGKTAESTFGGGKRRNISIKGFAVFSHAGIP